MALHKDNLIEYVPLLQSIKQLGVSPSRRIEQEEKRDENGTAYIKVEIDGQDYRAKYREFFAKVFVPEHLEVKVSSRQIHHELYAAISRKIMGLVTSPIKVGDAPLEWKGNRNIVVLLPKTSIPYMSSRVADAEYLPQYPTNGSDVFHAYRGWEHVQFKEHSYHNNIVIDTRKSLLVNLYASISTEYPDEKTLAPIEFTLNVSGYWLLTTWGESENGTPMWITN